MSRWSVGQIKWGFTWPALNIVTNNDFGAAGGALPNVNVPGPGISGFDGIYSSVVVIVADDLNNPSASPMTCDDPDFTRLHGLTYSTGTGGSRPGGDVLRVEVWAAVNITGTHTPGFFGGPDLDYTAESMSIADVAGILPLAIVSDVFDDIYNSAAPPSTLDIDLPGGYSNAGAALVFAHLYNDGVFPQDWGLSMAPVAPLVDKGGIARPAGFRDGVANTYIQGAALVPPSDGGDTVSFTVTSSPVTSSVWHAFGIAVVFSIA